MKKTILLLIVACGLFNVVVQASVLKGKVTDYVSCSCGNDHDKPENDNK